MNRNKGIEDRPKQVKDCVRVKLDFVWDEVIQKGNPDMLQIQCAPDQCKEREDDVLKLDNFNSAWDRTVEKETTSDIKDDQQHHRNDGYYSHLPKKPENFTGKLEGINNKIKVIKRKAYGFHDLRYFTLKIYQAFFN